MSRPGTPVEVRSRDRRDPAASMALTAHLRELRRRVTVSLLVVGAVSAVAFWWYDHGLGEFVRSPYCDLPPGLRGDLGGNCGLLVTDVLGGALVRLKVSLTVGVVLSAPVWAVQAWRFLAPGMRRAERRWTIAFAVASTVLFAIGVVLAWTVLETGLAFMLGLAGDGVFIALTATDYLRLVTSLLLAFGLALELPLLAVSLNLAGVVSHRTLAGGRRWIFFASLVFAALATPPDPVTMAVLALPMCLLFELAIQVARLVDRRRARRQAGAEPADDAPSTVEPAGPVDGDR